MMAKYWRVPFLMLTCGGVVFVLGKLLVAAPTVKSYSPKPFEFAESVPLPSWTLQESRSIFTDPNNSILDEKQYEYRKDNIMIDIQMRYLQGTGGEVRGFFNFYTDIVADPAIYQTEGGFYGVFVHEDTAYLSSCIPPRGNSVFTAKQFQRNALLHDIRPTRAVKWWVGQQKLIDQRCLWVNLSTPIENGSVDTAYERLEEAWQPWLAWWQDRFPNP